MTSKMDRSCYSLAAYTPSQVGLMSTSKILTGI
jgi:hypothetical protein